MAYNAQIYSPVATGQPIYQNIPSVPMVQNPSVTPNAYPSQFVQTPVLSVAYTQGEVGARSFLVAPNNTVVLLDSDTIDTENPVIYIKTTGADGKPQPMRRIIGTSSYPNSQGLFTSNQPESSQSQIDLSNYSTKEELNTEIITINDKIDNLNNIINDLSSSINNIDERFSNMFNAASSQNNQNNGKKVNNYHHNDDKRRN